MTTPTPPDLSPAIAQAQAILASLASGEMDAVQARKALNDAIPDPNSCTAEQAAEILAPFVGNFDEAARAEMLKLLMEDRSGGEALLEKFRQDGAKGSNQCTAGEARALLAAKNLLGASGEAIGRLLLKDRAAGLRMLAGISGLPKPDENDMPVPPQHDPAAWGSAADVNYRSAASAELIKTVQKEGRYTDYSSAREEARRRRPELFA